jgi:cytochrome c oxidase subunit 3
MDATLTNQSENENIWGGGNKPLNASYGKMMMWFFIVSDALTFSGFLAAYGFSRFKYIESWPIADEVFNHFPFLHGVDAPMYYVALMTFILIFSSVTMVLAVDAGHHMKKNKVAFYMLLTIVGGAIFLGSQAWEWKNFINGQYGAVETRGGQILQFVNAETGKRVTGFLANENLLIKTQQNDAQGHKIVLNREDSINKITHAVNVVEGANLIRNEYGSPLFANFFFFITGFHGFHVFTGVLINLIIFFNVVIGTYEKRGHYEMVEKVGLYWHFVDLVWVFVFTFFYLV